MNSGTLRPLDALGRTHPDHLEPYIWFRVRAAQTRPELSPPECSRESRSRTNERTIFRRVPKVRACMCVCVCLSFSFSFIFFFLSIFSSSIEVSRSSTTIIKVTSRLADCFRQILPSPPFPLYSVTISAGYYDQFSSPFFHLLYFLLFDFVDRRVVIDYDCNYEGYFAFG